LKKQILKILNVEEAETPQVSMLLLMGFFMGIFLATFEVSSFTLFITNFDEAKDLPIAIVASGLVGIIFTFIYNKLQVRISFRALGIGVLVVITTLIVGIRLGLSIVEDPHDLYYVSFVLATPFSYLALLIFWGVFGRLFNLRQAKRIIGSIDTGTLIASIVALFSIPFLLDNLNMEVSNLLLISLISAGAYLIVFIAIAIRFSLKSEVEKDKNVKQDVSYAHIAKNKYLGLMSVFIIASMVAITFIDYSFANVSKARFPGEQQLASFISYFEATVVIFSFLFQTFITDYIIETYGLKVALIVNPILIGIFTIAALLVGLLVGYDPAGGNFFYFFTAIAASKLFIDSIKDALDGPSFKLYFLPIDKNVKFDVQTKIEGVVNTFAYLFAGALILLINSFNVSLIFITIFLIPVLALWYYATNQMHAHYRLTLQETLVKNKSMALDKVSTEYAMNSILEREVNSDTDEKVIYGLKLMETLEPSLFESSIVDLLNSPSKTVSEYAKSKVKSLDLEYDRSNSEIKNLAKKALGEIEDNEVISIPASKLVILSKSINQEDRILAAKLLRKLINDKNIFVLLELLRDIDPKVKMAAIITARKTQRKETWGILIEMLDSPVFGHASSAALKQVGEPALRILETAFHRSGQSDEVMLKIVQIISRIGGSKCIKLLWDKIDYPNAKIVRQVLFALRYYNYQATESEVTAINALLDYEIGKAIWNLAAYSELPKAEHNKYLAGALKEEIDTNFEHVTMLLSILYDPESIQLVKENIETGTTEGVAFALELLDIFVSNELKPKLFPLFDDIPISDKLKHLQTYYPRQTYNPIQVLNYILNRNYNQNNRWTKACAIHSLAQLEDFRVSKGLLAQLFNPDMLLQEAAAWVIYHKDKEAYNKVAERLPEDVKRKLDESIEKNQLLDGLDDGFYLRIEVGMLLKTIPVFKPIRGTLLSELIDTMKVHNLEKGQLIEFNNGDDNKPILIVADGTAKIKSDTDSLFELDTHDVFGEIFVLNDNLNITQLEASEESVVFEISLNDFYNTLANHHELAQEFINSVSKNLKKEFIK